MDRNTVFSILVVFFIFAGGYTVSADSEQGFTEEELLKLEKEVNEVMNEELGQQVQTDDNKVSVDIEETTVELKEKTLELYNYDKDKIVNAFKQEARELKEGFSKTDIEVKKVKENSPKGNSLNSLVDNGSYYTAKVWSGIPAMGWGYINQDFIGRNSGNKLVGLKLQGNSYGTGLTLGSWTHNRSWIDIHKYGVTAGIYMKGTLSYIFKGSPIKTAPTFLKEISAFDL